MFEGFFLSILYKNDMPYSYIILYLFRFCFASVVSFHSKVIVFAVGTQKRFARGLIYLSTNELKKLTMVKPCIMWYDEDILVMFSHVFGKLGKY